MPRIEAVAGLERSGTPVRVITQNVDGLHQRAGVPERKVLELHGTARAVICTRCHARSSMQEALARVAAGEPDPPCRGVRRDPEVGDGDVRRAAGPAGARFGAGDREGGEVFFAVGTTLQVQPAASLAGVAAEHGARLVIVNAEPTPYDELAAEVIREPIGRALPRLLAGLAEHA